MSSDDLDFLLDDSAEDAAAALVPAWGPEAALALESCRGPLLDWAASALARRHPEVVRFRGPKGVQACRQDLDIHLKHLHGALRGLGAADLEAYAARRPALWRERGADPSVVPTGLAVLCEALWRFMPAGAAAPVLALVDAAGWREGSAAV